MNMMTTTTLNYELAVGFFKHVEGNYDHLWAPWLHGPSYRKVFQVVGDYSEMQTQMLDQGPNENARSLEVIAISNTSATDLRNVETPIKDGPVQNDVALWDCQDYNFDVERPSG